MAHDLEIFQEKDLVYHFVFARILPPHWKFVLQRPRGSAFWGLYPSLNLAYA